MTRKERGRESKRKEGGSEKNQYFIHLLGCNFRIVSCVSACLAVPALHCLCDRTQALQNSVEEVREGGERSRGERK